VIDDLVVTLGLAEKLALERIKRERCIVVDKAWFWMNMARHRCVEGRVISDDKIELCWVCEVTP